jgi:hypothetical protein
LATAAHGWILAVVEQLPAVESIEGAILVVRGQRVMLDAFLARLYGVSTSRLNEQVRRNQARFPADFAFRLTQTEWRAPNLSQIATGSQRHRDPARLPTAFTEHGRLMLANVLRSRRATDVSVLIVRAFVRMRSALATDAELAIKVDELARELARQDGKLVTHDEAILKLLGKIRRLTQFPEPARREIGFTAKWPKED